MSHQDDYIIVNCPNCSEPILVYLNELNCKIFRHGTYSHNLKQIDPHLPKEQCEQLIKENKIYGCGKPFQIVYNSEKGTFIAIVSDYL